VHHRREPGVRSLFVEHHAEQVDAGPHRFADQQALDDLRHVPAREGVVGRPLQAQQTGGARQLPEQRRQPRLRIAAARVATVEDQHLRTGQPQAFVESAHVHRAGSQADLVAIVFPPAVAREEKEGAFEPQPADQLAQVRIEDPAKADGVAQESPAQFLHLLLHHQLAVGGDRGQAFIEHPPAAGGESRRVIAREVEPAARLGGEQQGFRGPGKLQGFPGKRRKRAGAAADAAQSEPAVAPFQEAAEGRNVLLADEEIPHLRAERRDLLGHRMALRHPLVEALLGRGQRRRAARFDTPEERVSAAPPFEPHAVRRIGDGGDLDLVDRAFLSHRTTTMSSRLVR